MNRIPLPPELKLNIAELLDPISCFAFALTCKEYWELFNTIILEHRRLFEKYRCINTRNAGTLLWTRTKEILENPHLGYYVRELNLPSDRQTYWDPDAAHDFQLTDQSPRLPEEDQAVFLAAAQQLRNLYPTPGTTGRDLVAAIETKITLGGDDAIAAILVHHVPLLKVLRVTNLEADCLGMLLNEVARGYSDPVKAPQMPFQHLKSAAVAHYDSEYSCNPWWLYHLVCIPSLGAFAGRSIGGTLGHWAHSYAAENPVSNVRELFLLRSQLNVHALQEIFTAIKTLERFTYVGGGAIVDFEPYAPKKVIRALWKYHRHSLEHLILIPDECDPEEKEDEEEPSPSSVSLRDFPKLKTVRCSWGVIYPEEDEQSDVVSLEEGFYTPDDHDDGLTQPAPAVEDLLPASLESIELIDIPREHWDSVKEQLKGRNEKFPKLRSVRLRLRLRSYDDAIEGYDWKLNDNLTALDPHFWENPLMKLLKGHGFS